MLWRIAPITLNSFVFRDSDAPEHTPRFSRASPRVLQRIALFRPPKGRWTKAVSGRNAASAPASWLSRNAVATCASRNELWVWPEGGAAAQRSRVQLAQYLLGRQRVSRSDWGAESCESPPAPFPDRSNPRAHRFGRSPGRLRVCFVCPRPGLRPPRLQDRKATGDPFGHPVRLPEARRRAPRLVPRWPVATDRRAVRDRP